MTRKDFEVIARMIRDNRYGFKSNTAHAQFAADAAATLAGTNPRFNRDKFIRACMPSHIVGTRLENAWDRAMDSGRA